MSKKNNLNTGNKYETDYEAVKTKSIEVQKDFLTSSITQIKYELRNKKIEFKREYTDNEEKEFLEPCRQLRLKKDFFISELEKLGFEYDDNDFNEFLGFYEKVDIKLGLIDENTSTRNFEKIKYKEKRGLEFDNYVYEIKNELIENNDKIKNQSNKPTSYFEDGAYDIFTKWMSISKDEPYKRISFIFQMLKSENKLRKTNCKELSKWAYENEFIDEDTYDKICVNGCFLSPSKILTKGRKDMYYLLIDD